MRLLMTRPEPDALQSAEKLRTLGHDVIVQPGMETVFSNAPLELAEGADLVVTSKNGLRALNRLLPAGERSAYQVFTVGDATADLARAIGFETVFSASGTVDDLVELIKTHQLNTVAYIAGRDRKGDLDKKLAALGISVEVNIRYAAELVDQMNEQTLIALTEEELDGVLVYSQRTAEAFVQLVERYNLSQLTKSLSYFCLANSVASVFDRRWQVQPVVASSPTEQSLFETLDLIDKSV